MVKDDKGNPTPIHSLGKFKELNARCAQRKFMYPNIKAPRRKFEEWNVKFQFSLFGASLFGHSLLDFHSKWNNKKKIVLIESR